MESLPRSEENTQEHTADCRVGARNERIPDSPEAKAAVKWRGATPLLPKRLLPKAIYRVNRCLRTRPHMRKLTTFEHQNATTGLPEGHFRVDETGNR